MTDILPIATLVLLITVVALLLGLLWKASRASNYLLDSRLDVFEKVQERTERAVREEVALNRDELGKAVKEQRQELTEAFKIFGDSVAQRMTDVANCRRGISIRSLFSLALSQRRAVNDWIAYVRSQPPEPNNSGKRS